MRGVHTTGKTWKLPYLKANNMPIDFDYLVADTPDWKQKPYLKTAIKSYLCMFGYRLADVEQFVESRYTTT